MPQPEFIYPDWPATGQVHACVSTRRTGFSVPPYDSFNLAAHVGDDADAVGRNRALLREFLQLVQEPVWLNQVHGDRVLDLDGPVRDLDADAAVTSRQHAVCSVMTADCLPLLFASTSGDRVGAAHAGWRGLAAGIIEATVAEMHTPAEQLLVWLGPAIGPQHFEVGEDVRQAFMQQQPRAEAAFIATRPGHWLADIYQLARLRLARLGIHQIYGGDLCSYTDAQRFYSYRRDKRTGRMASLIWLGDNT